MPGSITLDNLTLGYDRHPAVHHLTGTIDSGALLAVVGPNGGGKSTLLKAIAGLITPMEGRITVGASRRSVGYLPQVAEIDRSFPISVYEFVAMGAYAVTGLFGGLTPRTKVRIEHAIAAVGLSGLERRTIAALSGGQMQRMLFARLLMQDASIVLIDEPFNAIDEATTADLLALVRRWHAEGRTIVAVLHDLAMVRTAFPHTLLLARECIGWGTTQTVLTESALATARARMTPSGTPDVVREEAA